MNQTQFTVGLTNDEGLLERFSNGDESALKKVYEMYFPNLLFTAKGIVKDEEEAKDIVSDAFLKGWQKRGSFETLHKLKSYLYVVIKHACFHYVEKIRNKNETFKDVRLLSDLMESPQALRQLEHLETIQQIGVAIGRLPEKQREFIWMQYISGMTINEIAQKYHQTPQHTRVFKQRTLKLLKQHVNSAEYLCEKAAEPQPLERTRLRSRKPGYLDKGQKISGGQNAYFSSYDLSFMVREVSLVNAGQSN